MPTQLLENLPRFNPVTNDHSSIKLAMECMRKYFYRIILGRTPFSSKYQTVFDFGSAYHLFREVLELEYMKTKDKEASLLIASTAALKYPLTPGEGKYQMYTRQRLMRSCMVAYKHWCKEKDQGAIEVIAVEQPFNIEMPDGTFVSGRADQIIKWNGKIWGRDFKTTSKMLKYFEATLDPNDQAIRYIYMESKLHFGKEAIHNGQMIQGIIFEVMQNLADTNGGKTEGACNISNVTITKSKYQLAMWEKEQLWMHKVIALAKEEDVWPMQPSNCSFCDFQTVCRKSSESAMEYVLKNEYKLSPWDNTKVHQLTIAE